MDRFCGDRLILEDLSELDIIVENQCVGYVSVHLDIDFIKELGSADEINEKLRRAFYKIIQEIQDRRFTQ